MLNHDLLKVRDLNCRISEKLILRDISFTITRGDYLAIIGPNGAGKSTLLRCLDRIIDFGPGDILLEGVSIHEMSREQLSQRIGYVPQIDRTSPPFTVGQFIEMGRYVHTGTFSQGLFSSGSEQDRQAILTAMEMTDTAQFADRMLDTLSGGERQMVHIAAAIAQQTEILLLDEPTSFLDYRHQANVGHVLKRLNREHGTTIVTVTHDVNRAVLESRRIIALQDGRIAAEGTPDELITRDRLRKLYDVDFELLRHPESGRMLLVPPA